MIRHIVTTDIAGLQARGGVLFNSAPPSVGVSDGIVGDLVDTLEAHEICVGLAAPQLGIPTRIVVVCPDRVRGHSIVMINPEVLGISGQKDKKRESCMSLPGFMGPVTRREKARIQFTSIDGETKVVELKGFDARVALHEIDHLDGLIYADRTAEEGSELTVTDLFENSNFAAVQEVSMS